MPLAVKKWHPDKLMSLSLPLPPAAPWGRVSGWCWDSQLEGSGGAVSVRDEAVPESGLFRACIFLSNVLNVSIFICTCIFWDCMAINITHQAWQSIMAHPQYTQLHSLVSSIRLYFNIFKFTFFWQLQIGHQFKTHKNLLDWGHLPECSGGKIYSNFAKWSISKTWNIALSKSSLSSVNDHLGCWVLKLF